MTIKKNTSRAMCVIADAENITCYSLSNNFSGQRLADKPVVWGGPVINGRYSQMVEVSQRDFLFRELKQHHAKLTTDGDGCFVLHIHSNLWYEFTSAVQS